MKVDFTIIHFSQDFTKGKPQLGGFSRIYNTCSDNNKHIIYTISTTIEVIEEYYIDDVLIVQIPVKERPSGVLNQFKLFIPIANKICEHISKHKIQPDLFFGHSHQGNFLILQKVRDKLFSNLKILWEANGIGGCPRVKAPIKQRLANNIQYRLQKYVFKRADAIIAQTKQSKLFIKDEFLISEGKIYVVANAIMVSKEFEPPKKDFSRIKVLCFGLFDELNGIPFLIDVLNKNNFDKIDFFFAGFGKYLNEVKKLETEQNNVTYLGQLPFKEMMEELPKYHYLVIPRLNTLGAQLYIPTKLLEGMYFGVVPICSNVEGMTCVVDNTENGLLFNTGNKEELVALFKELKNYPVKKYDSLQKNAIKKVKDNYNWENNYEILNKIYGKFTA